MSANNVFAQNVRSEGRLSKMTLAHSRATSREEVSNTHVLGILNWTYFAKGRGGGDFFTNDSGFKETGILF